MAVQRHFRRSILLVGVAAVVAGCQGHVTTGSLSATTPDSAGATRGNGTSAAPAPTAGGSGVNTCKAANLALKLGPGDGGAAGSRYPALQFTNVGNTTCLIGGFPGVSYVSGDDGHQVGSPAVRTGPAGDQVTLAPGMTASAVVQEVNPGNYPAAQCKPVPVRGFRVYAPNDTTGMFVPFESAAATACSSTTMPAGQQLSVHSVTPGTGE
jgi:hypothetical protein